MRRVRIWPLFGLLALLNGCHALPAGRLDAVGSKVVAPGRGEVYLVRGWRDLWSEGIDQLASDIRAAGLNAEVYRESQWRDLADAIITQRRTDLSPPPLILIGFSYGADDVLRIATKLDRHAIATDLLITIDPVTPPPVPAGIRRCYNYYQTNGIWDLFPWLRGVRLVSSRPGQLVNVDIRRERSQWVEQTLSHATIAANPSLHREIVQRVIDAHP